MLGQTDRQGSDPIRVPIFILKYEETLKTMAGGIHEAIISFLK